MSLPTLACWPFGTLNALPLVLALEPVCAAEPLVPHSPSSPLEPDMAAARHFVAHLVDWTQALHPVSRWVDLNSVRMPGAVAPCWSFEPLIGFPLEPVCNSELFALHSISPLEPD